MASWNTFFKCALFLLFQSVVSLVTAQPGEPDHTSYKLANAKQLLAEYPDSVTIQEDIRILESQLTQYRTAIRKREKSKPDYLIPVINGTTIDADFTVEEAQLTLGNYYAEHKQYIAALEWYLSLLNQQHDSLDTVRRQVTKIIVDAQQNQLLYDQNSLRYEDLQELATAIVFTEDAFGQFQRSQSLTAYENWKSQHYRLITKISSIALTRMRDGDVLQTRNLLESVKEFVSRDTYTNTYDFEQYTSLYSALSLSYAQQQNQDDSLFIENVYLLTGSPIGQLPEISKELMNYYFRIQERNETWYFVKAIFELRKAYYASYDGLTTVQKQKHIVAARNAILNLELFKEITTEKRYMLYYLKSIIAFEFDGKTNDAYTLINKSLELNTKDFFAYEYKQRILRIWTDSPNYTSNATETAKKQRLRENARIQSREADLVTIKKIPVSLIAELIGLKNATL